MQMQIIYDSWNYLMKLNGKKYKYFQNLGDLENNNMFLDS